MKIKIIADIPTLAKPEIGKIYDVTRTNKRKKGGDVHFIEVNGEEVGILAREMEIVER